MGEASIRRQPNYGAALRVLTASYAMTGQQEQAQNVMRRLRELFPTLRVSNLWDFMMHRRRPEDRERFAEGLRRAGLPELRNARVFLSSDVAQGRTRPSRGTGPVAFNPSSAHSRSRANRFHDGHLSRLDARSFRSMPTCSG
jgi:hypothetical protein